MEYLKEPIDPKAFEGKTVARVQRVAANFLIFEFTDGSKVALESLPESGIFNSSPALVTKDLYIVGVKCRSQSSLAFVGKRHPARPGRNGSVEFAYSWKDYMRFTWEQALVEIPKWTFQDVVLFRIMLVDDKEQAVPVEIPKEVLAEKELKAQQQLEKRKLEGQPAKAKPSMDQRPATK